MEIEILEFIDSEIESFEKEKKQVPEEYRDVKPTIKNQEMRIEATLTTLKSMRRYIEELKQKGIAKKVRNR